MENVCYLLGAGFSAPLGLPLMGNFRIKASEMLENYPTEYSHFRAIMTSIVNMGNYKNFFQGNPLNIEEALSVVEMERFLNIKQEQIDIDRFIKDVIKYCTPNIVPYDDKFNNFEQVLFGNAKIRNLSYEPYGYFLCSLLRLELEKSNYHLHENLRSRISLKSVRDTGYRYQVITLNYDRILENCQEFLTSNFGLDSSIGFVRPSLEADYTWNTPYLCKLHGCVNERIVPPTWNKGSEKSILGDWRCAHKMLSEATQIRIIGYSFPESDSYIKYLLKSAVRVSTRLRQIDYIVLGSDEGAISRCENFISIPVRVVKTNAIDYLYSIKALVNQTTDRSSETNSPSNLLSFVRLEEAHEAFCNSLS